MLRATLLTLFAIAQTLVLAGCGGNAASPAPTANNTPPSAAPPSTPTPTPTSSSPSCNYSYATFKDATGADAKFLYGNNDNGAMVGQDSTGRGFIFQNGQFTYPAINGVNITPYAIANNGLVAGNYSTGERPNITTHGVIYNNGQTTSFDAPNSNTTVPAGISSDGTVVGNGYSIAIYGSNWLRHPDGTFISLSDGFIPEGLRTPGDINDNDIVVLDANISPAHPNDYATWQNGTFTYHTFPSAIGSGGPLGNNNQGDIVGVTQNNGVLTAWALLGSNTSCSIGFPGAVATFAEDINDARVIVGYYTMDKINNHAFVATPK